MPDLSGCTDAQKWAEQFVNQFEGMRVGCAEYGTPDVHTVMTWFANAIETGRSAGQRHDHKNDLRLNEARQALLDYEKEGSDIDLAGAMNEALNGSKA